MATFYGEQDDATKSNPAVCTLNGGGRQSEGWGLPGFFDRNKQL